MSYEFFVTFYPQMGNITLELDWSIMVKNRLPEIDGLRAIAVLAVVLYHYFQRLPEYYPYGSSLLPLTKYGFLGMYLFFIISGFVIAISLQSGTGFWEFLSKRLFRLWPALAVCSLITFFFMHAFETQYSDFIHIEISSFLPSLTFTRPDLWRTDILGDGYVDGVYWSLSVEVMFYLFAVATSTIAGPIRFADWAILGLLGSQFLLAMAAYVGNSPLPNGLVHIFIPLYSHLFAAGIVFARIHRQGTDLRSLALLFWCFSVAVNMSNDAWEVAFQAVIFLLVAACTWRLAIAKLLAWPPLVWLGVCSYSVYLLHNNIGISLINLLPQGLSSTAYFLAVAVIFSGILLLSRVIYLTVETTSQSFVKRLWRNSQTEKILAAPLSRL